MDSDIPTLNANSNWDNFAFFISCGRRHLPIRRAIISSFTYVLYFGRILAWTRTNVRNNMYVGDDGMEKKKENIDLVEYIINKNLLESWMISLKSGSISKKTKKI